jgi:hypothetical protein
MNIDQTFDEKKWSIPFQKIATKHVGNVFSHMCRVNIHSNKVFIHIKKDFSVVTFQCTQI